MEKYSAEFLKPHNIIKMTEKVIDYPLKWYYHYIKLGLGLGLFIFDGKKWKI